MSIGDTVHGRIVAKGLERSRGRRNVRRGRDRARQWVYFVPLWRSVGMQALQSSERAQLAKGAESAYRDVIARRPQLLAHAEERGALGVGPLPSAHTQDRSR